MIAAADMTVGDSWQCYLALMLDGSHPNPAAPTLFGAAIHPTIGGRRVSASPG